MEATQSPAMLRHLSVRQLCAAFEATNAVPPDLAEESYIIRGWVMDELEARDPARFEAWVMTPDTKLADTPSAFF